MVAASPYATVEPFGHAVATHVPDSAEEDRDRIRAYDTYADIYHNVPTIFEAVLSVDAGNEKFRRLIPSARTIVETANRYLARGLAWHAEPPTATSAADPNASTAVGDEVVSATLGTLRTLFRREEFGAKFLSMKRWMLIRGDGMLHLTADPLKPEGQRLRITELDPGTYFPITDPADAERTIGCYIVNIVRDDEDEEVVARLEYRRILDDEQSALYQTPVGNVFMRLTFWPTDGWDDRNLGPDDAELEPAPTPARFSADRFVTLLAGQPLPTEVTAIPVYHFPNNRRGGSIFGTSEIQGIETLIAGINQTATDEDLAVALQGLGMYWTTSGKPRDEDGNEVPWKIAPGSMLELEEGAVGRIEGISSVQASVGHIDLLKREMRETSATPDVAVGAVGAQTVASGVALAIEMAPIIAKNEEKEESIGGKLDQLVYDLLNGWLPAYEGIPATGVVVTAEFAPPLPIDRAAVIQEIVDLVTAKLISAEYGRTMLSEKLGFTFSSDILSQITAETTALEDAMGARLDAEAAAAPGSEVGL